MMNKTIVDLIKPVTCAREMGRRLSRRLRRPINLGLPADFKEICDELEDLACSLDDEVNHGKDRFFFNALDADVDDLCEDHKESMRVAFHVSDDRSQALKWKPHSGDCCWRNCKNYSWKSFEDEYHGSYLQNCKDGEYLNVS